MTGIDADGPDVVADTDGREAPAAPRRRWGPLLGAVAVAVAVAVGVGLYLTAQDEEGGPVQTLCGLPRKAGSPLDVLLPKGRPGVEERGESDEPGKQVSCDVTVDGKEAVHVLAIAMPADTVGPPTDDEAQPAYLLGRGAVSASTTGMMVDYCPKDRTRVVHVSVFLGSDQMPEPGADVTPFKSALKSLAETVLAEQGPTLCG
ncbi:hypothetical protein ACWEQL_14950 [Kitasatospora sp. NPDC004240]